MSFFMQTALMAQDVKVDISINRGTVGDLVEKITAQTNYKFSYDSSILSIPVSNISVQSDDMDITALLDKVLSGSGLRYEINKRVILLSKATTQSRQPGKNITVNGIVLDENGQSVIGANVVVKGKNTGVITDLDGKFTLEALSNDVIEVSYIGYDTKTIALRGQTSLEIRLSENSELLEEVVVVGYGTQKKVNLTGSVSAVKFDEKMTNRSLTNVSSALSGMVPGLAVTQGNGMAGEDGSSLLVRGMGTVNNADPLIVVDGMPDVDINRLNMNDIESISVLKDAASSAVYGSRAANGVILITTKSGKGSGKSKLSFNASYAIATPTKIADFTSDYATAMHVMQLRSLTSTKREDLKFQDGTIDEWAAMGMIDPMRFPNTDWWNLIMDNGAIQNYNVSFTGSSDKTNFYISAGVMDNQGMMMNNDYTRYNFRTNYDYKVSDKINVGTRISANWTDRVSVPDDGFFFSSVAGIYPYDPETGYFGGAMAEGEDPQVGNMMVNVMNNQQKVTRQEIDANLFMDWNILPGLTARVNGAISYYNQFQKDAPIPTGYYYDFQRGQELDKTAIADNIAVKDRTNTGYKTLMSAQINYNKKFLEHHEISFMAVYSEEYWYNRYQYSARNDRLHPSLEEIDAALTTIQDTGGNSDTEGLRSVIGRLNYSLYDRYLFEANLRCDGSSRFYKGSRYGVFPSIAMAWRFSEESFIKDYTQNWLSNGKFKISYGSLGNNSGVGLTEQREVLNEANYIENGDNAKGFVNKKMINRALSWETTTVLNTGFEFGFFNNRLTAEIDYYDKLTTGMLRPSDMSIHLTGSYSAPKQNIGNLRNRGVELNFGWRDTFAREFNYTLNANFSYNLSNLEQWNEYLGRGNTFIDMPYHFLYTYINTDIAQTWQDVYNNTPQGAKPGDILRKDINGDGRIDDNDQVAYPRISRDRPTMYFGLNASLSWRGFDLALLFQGSAGRKDTPLSNAITVNFQDTKYAVTEQQITNPWSLDNRNSIWPRLGSYGTNSSDGTFWMENLAFVRLKNLQFGYNLPVKWIEKVGMSRCRLYFTAENLFTITEYSGIDPESSDKNNLYPLTKSFTFGVNVDF